MYDIESIRQAATVAEAIALLQADPEALLISGGSDLLIKIRAGKLAGKRLVSIHELPELRRITKDRTGTIRIGSTCSFAQITADPLIQQYLPTLGYAVDQAGGPQLRQVGTIGGNVCNGVTSADSASTLLTLNAKLEISSPAGQRQTALADFYAGPGRVHLRSAEIVTAICIQQADYAGYHGHYIKYAMREAMDIATLGCAVHVKLTPDQDIADIRLAYGVAAPVPIRCPLAEAAVRGKPYSVETGKLLGEMALREVTPRTSWRASREFRLQLVRELAARALQQAVAKEGAAQ